VTSIRWRNSPAFPTEQLGWGALTLIRFSNDAAAGEHIEIKPRLSAEILRVANGAAPPE